MLLIYGMSDWMALTKRDILDILIGDTPVSNDSRGDFRLPYLSGPVICQISQLFGLNVFYVWKGGNQSRWGYMQDLLKHAIEANRISDVLNYLFRKEQFERELKELPLEEIAPTHAKIIELAIERINAVLSFSDRKLVFVNKQFHVIPIKSEIDIELPTLKNIDREYIKEISDRAEIDIDNGAFDSAITKSRTLVEEVFCYVIEKKDETPSDSGNIKTLYNQVKKLYNMHTSQDLDIRVNTLLSGLEKIVTAISEMRNRTSDSHGLGIKRIGILEHHARLLVNSAKIMADFILSIEKNANKK